jgi:hypothetical protein
MIRRILNYEKMDGRSDSHGNMMRLSTLEAQWCCPLWRNIAKAATTNYLGGATAKNGYETSAGGLELVSA